MRGPGHPHNRALCRDLGTVTALALVLALLAAAPGSAAPPGQKARVAQSVMFCGEAVPVATTTSLTCYKGREGMFVSATTKPMDLRPLSKLTELRELNLTSGAGGGEDFILILHLVDLSPLSGLTDLRELSFGHTSLGDLSALAGLTKITRLSIHASPIHDLSPLRGMTGLRELDLDNTCVSDLTPLKGLVNLESLNLSHTAVRDLRPLYGLKKLRTLGLSDEVSLVQRNSLKQRLPNLKIYQSRHCGVACP